MSIRLNFFYLSHVILVSLIAVISGCGTPPPVQRAAPAPPPTAAAEAYLRQFDFTAAAGEYARLATADPANASRYVGLAALSHLEAGDTDAAAQMLSNRTDESQDSATALASAALQSASGDIAAAEQTLATVDVNRFSPFQRGVYSRLKARTELHAHRYLDAFRSLVDADTYALPPHTRERVHADTWLALSHLDTAALSVARDNASGNVGGWLDLVDASRPYLHDNAQLDAALETWRQVHPQHPANVTTLEALRELAESLGAQARHIALILPFDGQYASAASAVRDGFLSAWFADPRRGAASSGIRLQR